MDASLFILAVAVSALVISIWCVWAVRAMHAEIVTLARHQLEIVQMVMAVAKGNLEVHYIAGEKKNERETSD